MRSSTSASSVPAGRGAGGHAWCKAPADAPRMLRRQPEGRIASYYRRLRRQPGGSTVSRADWNDRVSSRIAGFPGSRTVTSCNARERDFGFMPPWQGRRGVYRAGESAEETSMSGHYDTLETRSSAEREKALMQALPQQIAHAKANAPFFAGWLEGCRSSGSDVACGAGQAAGAARRCWARCRRRIRRWRADRRADEQRCATSSCRPARSSRSIPTSPIIFAARAMHAAGFRPGHVVNTFSASLTPARIALMGSALRALGCAVVPGGVGNTELQLRRHRRHPAERLCRHAVLPQDPDRRRPSPGISPR